MKEGENKVESSMFEGSTLTKSTQKSELVKNVIALKPGQFTCRLLPHNCPLRRVRMLNIEYMIRKCIKHPCCRELCCGIS